MDIVTLGAALNGSAEYVNSHFKSGSNIQIVDNPDGTQTINASGEVSAEDTVARADIAAIRDGETLDSFGDVETALGDKQNTISDLATIRSGAALGATAVQPETGKGLSTNDYTTAEKTKLAGIEAQANKTTVDDALSGSSTNPVQNKVVKSALDGKADTSTTYTKTEVDTALSGKQTTLTTVQLTAVNSGIDSTKVAQIETNKNNIAITDITSEITVTSGYTLSALSNIWKQGNHVWGQIIITVNNGDVSQTQTKVAQITRQYAPTKTYIAGCQLGGGLFDVRNNGYLFIRNNSEQTGGEIIVTAYNSNNTTINIHIDYII